VGWRSATTSADEVELIFGDERFKMRREFFRAEIIVRFAVL
jgi:hypothetical protein